MADGTTNAKLLAFTKYTLHTHTHTHTQHRCTNIYMYRTSF